MVNENITNDKDINKYSYQAPLRGLVRNVKILRTEGSQLPPIPPELNSEKTTHPKDSHSILINFCIRFVHEATV